MNEKELKTEEDSYKCPICNKPMDGISIDSQINGYIDIGYDCSDCKITIWRWKIEKLQEDE